jgi:hypothetical protein
VPARNGDDIFAAVGAIQFNVNGYAHEIGKARIEAAGESGRRHRKRDPAGSKFQHKLPPLDLTNRARDGFTLDAGRMIDFPPK